jgi:hypothetical protein
MSLLAAIGFAIYIAAKSKQMTKLRARSHAVSFSAIVHELMVEVKKSLYFFQESWPTLRIRFKHRGRLSLHESVTYLLLHSAEFHPRGFSFFASAMARSPGRKRARKDMTKVSLPG